MQSRHDDRGHACFAAATSFPSCVAAEGGASDFCQSHRRSFDLGCTRCNDWNVSGGKIMRKILAIVSVIIPLFYSPAAVSQSTDLRTRLLGTWKIIAATREEIPSGVKTDQMGPRPAGY